MNDMTLHQSETTADEPRFALPIWTLLLLSPFISEVLSGSTRTSILFVFIPEVMVWGVGALLCRELVRRWMAGGTSLLLLGLSLDCRGVHHPANFACPPTISWLAPGLWPDVRHEPRLLPVHARV